MKREGPLSMIERGGIKWIEQQGKITGAEQITTRLECDEEGNIRKRVITKERLKFFFKK